MNKNDFFIGIDDITYYRGKINHMEREYVPIAGQTYDERQFSRKFVKDPFTAILNAVYQTRTETQDPEIYKYFHDNVVYDPVTGCWEFIEYQTIGTGLPPKPVHWDKFVKGEYELCIAKHQLQALKTEVVNFEI